MFMDLSEPLEVIWPEGVALRPYREDEDDVLMWDTMRAGFGDDWGGPTERDEWLRTHRGAPGYASDLWFFAARRAWRDGWQPDEGERFLPPYRYVRRRGFHGPHQAHRAMSAEVLSDPEAMRFYSAPFERAKVEWWIERNIEGYRTRGYGLRKLF
jgi:hypothetical protein